MSRYAELTAEVDASPGGGRIGAFFDVDHTLLAEFSAESMFRDTVRAGLIGKRDAARSILNAIGFQLGRVEFGQLIGLSAKLLEGEKQSDMEEIGKNLFLRRLAAQVYPESRALVEAHRRRGHTVVLLSSATRYQVETLAEDLGVDHMLCNDYEADDGIFTGRMVDPVIWSEGKAVAARELAEEEGIDLSRSWFYSDGEEDVPLMQAVGNPRPTNPHKKMAAVARERGWPVLSFSSRGRPSVLDYARTAAVVGSFAAAAWLSVPVTVLNGSQRAGRNVATSVFGDLATAVAGIRLRVTGEQHIWEQRPAVYIFNHQSYMDTPILLKLIREDVTGIAKKELRRTPVLGQVLALGGTVFVDRQHHAQAVEALKPAVEALRNGTSLIIAPEGTRSPTPRLGVFKKGAFHLAMEAGVPIVPIVLDSTLDSMPKHTFVVRSAPVDVTVLPPVPTEGWTHEMMDGEIEKIRRMFVDVLER